MKRLRPPRAGGMEMEMESRAMEFEDVPYQVVCAAW